MNKKLILIVLVLGIIAIYFGCSTSDTGTTTQNPTGSAKQYLLIETPVHPSVMPDTGSFLMWIRAINLPEYAYVRIRIKEFTHDSCTALDTLHYFHFTTSYHDDSISLRVNNFNTGCHDNNTVYRISIIDSVDHVSDQMYYVRGNPTNLSDRSASVKLVRMPYSKQIHCDSVKKSLDSTFHCPIESKNLHINLSYPTSWYSVDSDRVFEAEGSDGLFYFALAEYAQNFYDINYPYMLLMAKNQNMYRTGGDVRVGISWNHQLGLVTGDWSFVFSELLNSQFGSGFDTASVYSYTACHEMAHQLGNCFGSGNGEESDENDPLSDHYYHTGRNDTLCCLWKPHRDDSRLTRNTGYFPLCERHIYRIRTNLGSPPPFVFPASEYFFINSTINSNKYKIFLKLAKYSYKKFEPIMAQIGVINNDNSPLNLANIFSPSLEEASFTIEDENGKILNTNKFPLSFEVLRDVPRFIVQPHDTLIGTIPFNNWGKASKYNSANDNEEYFGNFGYLESGSYKVHVSFNFEHKVGGVFKSNYVEFQVNTDSEEDIEILKLYKENKYRQAVDMFPANPLSEHMYVMDLLTKHIKIFNDSNYALLNNLESDYEGFISKYPDSYYLLNDWFMSPYIFKVFKGQNNLSLAISNIKNQLNNIYIDKFLSDQLRVRRLVERQ